MTEEELRQARIDFGFRIKRVRLEKGLSQEALAELASLDRTYVSGCERGKRNIGIENIFKLSSALGVDAADLVSDGQNSSGK